MAITRPSRMGRRFREASSASVTWAAAVDAPRRIRNTVIDFSCLSLPVDVRRALADAFWNHFGVRRAGQVLLHWAYIKVFVRFAAESQALASLADIRDDLLVRYIEWLNAQRRSSGQPWSPWGRAGPYISLRKLLQWLLRCRPGVLGPLHFPFNPFPWRNRDSGRVPRLPARQLRAILKACERDISALRELRARGERARIEAGSDPHHSLRALLQAIDGRYGGIVPAHLSLAARGEGALRRALVRHGGTHHVEPYLYPRSESLLPYYLALLIHSAGNPEPIAELSCDCLQPIPLLDDRQALIWAKRRAGQIQRRSFSSTDPFEPPALVRELAAWTGRLRAHAPKGLRDRLLLFKGPRGINAWSAATAKAAIRNDFCPRHGLPPFALASIRPSVLSAFYRASGDLLQVKAVANHRALATTVRYVQGPEVEREHHTRIAALQAAFLGQIRSPTRSAERAESSTPPPARVPLAPSVASVSMFGFDCKDPLAGIAPGTHRGELCSHFLGCFTCPNAIISPDPASLARLLQTRDHLRAAALQVHPARFVALYAPLLRVLEEDVLTRFGASELAAAVPWQARLPPLPELR